MLVVKSQKMRRNISVTIGASGLSGLRSMWDNNNYSNDDDNDVFGVESSTEDMEIQPRNKLSKLEKLESYHRFFFPMYIFTYEMYVVCMVRDNYERGEARLGRGVLIKVASKVLRRHVSHLKAEFCTPVELNELTVTHTMHKCVQMYIGF